MGTLGGLFLFGPIGFIAGPIGCGLFLTVWDIYGTAFSDVLPPVKSLHGRSRSAAVQDPPSGEPPKIVA